MKPATSLLFLLSLGVYPPLAAASQSAITAANSTSIMQPAVESLDLGTIAQIRDEGLLHSHIMEYASGLFDGVGPRLTGSPEFERGAQWCIEQLQRMGASRPHEESWGDFGMGWTQLGTSVLMTAPSTGTILAQATPWSPATKGEIDGEAIAVPEIENEDGFARWKGKLAGKIVLYGKAPAINADPTNPLEHYDAAKLQNLASYPLNGDQEDVLPNDPLFWEKIFAQMAFKEKVARFFADEHAAAILLPGGFRGVIQDDTRSAMGWFVYRPEHKQALPSAVIASEAFLRMHRLASHNVPVKLKVNIDTRFTGDHVEGQNVIADIPGTDASLKDQVVMVGGHLDSWIAGTGATDDGAGAIIALEAMRILRALNIQPRRTIRIGLWGGEEQGIFGSSGYIRNHYGSLHYSTKAEDQAVPEFLREQVGAVTVKADHAKFDAYFNADNGTGRFLGIFSEGNAQAAHIFEQWAAPIKDLGFTTVSMRNTGSTDHVPFEQVGLPGFQFIQDPRDYGTVTHHSNQDTFERLSEPDLRQAATVMAIFVYNAAQREAMMPRLPMPNPPLDQKRDKPLDGIYATPRK